MTENHFILGETLVIKIYSAPNVGAVLDLTDQNSIVSGHNRRAFIPDIRKLYVRNDDVTKWVSDITVQATSTGIDLINGTNGFGFKFFWGDIEPTNRVWQNIGYNNPINVSNIGTTLQADTSFHPFWMNVSVSPIVDVGLYEAKLVANYIEHAV